MKIKQFLTGVVLLGLTIVLAGQNKPVSARGDAQTQDHFLYLPLIQKGYSSSHPGIVIDHKHTDISKIPDFWIDQARESVIHYATTSHGSQVLSGLEWLETRDSKYNVDIRYNNTVTLPSDITAMRFYVGNNYSDTTYITPDKYWETVDGRVHTRSVVNTGWFGFSLWAWCGQMSYYSEAQVQLYNDTMAAFESQYPGVRFIYDTGHTDGSAPGSVLWHNNDWVRQYVQDHSQALFDFADIESYDPAGNFYPQARDACDWCDDWCAAHSTNFECQSLPGCAHSHGLQCALKAQAFWWLMARLAGWDGTPVQ